MAAASAVLPVRGVLFDIDGTLVDYAASERAGILAWLAACGLPADAAAADTWAEVTRVSHARFTNGELGFVEQRLARVRAFLGRPLDDAAATAWFGGFLAEYERRWSCSRTSCRRSTRWRGCRACGSVSSRTPRRRTSGTS